METMARHISSERTWLNPWTRSTSARESSGWPGRQHIVRSGHEPPKIPGSSLGA